MVLSQEQEEQLLKLLSSPVARMTDETLYSFHRAVELSQQNSNDIQCLKHDLKAFEEKSFENDKDMAVMLASITQQVTFLSKSATTLRTLTSDSTGQAKLIGAVIAGFVMTSFSILVALSKGTAWIKEVLLK